MARQEQDREDLLRDATALVERVELRVAGYEVPVVVGFRRDGCASIYIGQDPAYHFNTAGELRRAFVDGRLYKAERGRLASLVRQRTDSEVQLLRSDLTDIEAANFCKAMRAHCAKLGQPIAIGEFTLVGQVPDDIDVAARASKWLADMPEEVAIAPSPRAV
jgi:hypothetical protein